MTDTILPPQISLFHTTTLHHHHGPTAEDLPVPQAWVPHRRTGQLWSQPLAVMVTAIIVSVHAWENTSPDSFWLLTDSHSRNTLVTTEKPFSNWENSNGKQWLCHPTCLSFSSADTASPLNMVFSRYLHSQFCTTSFIYVSGTTTFLREFLKGGDSH